MGTQSAGSGKPEEICGHQRDWGWQQESTPGGCCPVRLFVLLLPREQTSRNMSPLPSPELLLSLQQGDPPKAGAQRGSSQMETWRGTFAGEEETKQAWGRRAMCWMYVQGGSAKTWPHWESSKLPHYHKENFRTLVSTLAGHGWGWWWAWVGTQSWCAVSAAGRGSREQRQKETRGEKTMGMDWTAEKHTDKYKPSCLILIATSARSQPLSIITASWSDDISDLMEGRRLLKQKKDGHY